ncbi:MAG: SDR family NAD(P)-dependent oxidoreductase [Candidatus Promineifilaceae bacterium]
MEDLNAESLSSEVEDPREEDTGSWIQDTFGSPDSSRDADSPRDADSEFRENQAQEDSQSLKSPPDESLSSSLEALSALLDETLEQAKPMDLSTPTRPYDRNEPPAGSVVITGTGFYMPGMEQRGSEPLGDFDLMSHLAIIAGFSALKDAGIPAGTPLSERDQNGEGEEPGPAAWALPEPLQHETGIVFATAYPGRDDLYRVLERYDGYKRVFNQLKMLGELSRSSQSEMALQIKHIVEMLKELASDLDGGREPETVLRALANDYDQVAGTIGALGPVTQLAATGAGTTQAIALAEDWIRTGRCRRVIVICTTVTAGDGFTNWISFNKEAAGGLAPNTNWGVEPGQNGGSEGMGACALVLESEDAVRERGMRGVAELLGSETGNAIAGSDHALIDQVSTVMERLVGGGERRFDLYRADMAPRLVFLAGDSGRSDKEYPIGIDVLESVFGASADKVIITSVTSLSDGDTGSGFEDAVAVKILESGYVPPASDRWFENTALDRYLLSKGEHYAPHYLLNMGDVSGARFTMTLLRWIPGEVERVDDTAKYHQWLADISGYDGAEVEVKDLMLRLVVGEVLDRPPKPSIWRYGVGPTILALQEDWVPSGAPPERIVGLATRLDGSKPEVEPEDEVVLLAVQDQASIPPFAETLPETELDAIAIQTLMIAAEHTGYAIDVLDLDEDLKTGLAIGEKEHAELLIDICQVFGLSGYVNLKIGDYPNLAHMIALVRERRPDLVNGRAQDGQVQETASARITRDDEVLVDDSLTAVVLQIVSEETGYPVDMLDLSLDMDLEEDLGVDAIEQMEIFRALCQALALECPETNQLVDYPTLSHIIAYLQATTSDHELYTAAELLSGSEDQERGAVEDLVSEEGGIDGPPIEFAIADTVLLITAEQTGIPANDIRLDADMVESLGLDERTQAEVVSAVLESFGIPQPEGMRPYDYPTLSALIVFIRESRPDLVDTELPPVDGIEDTLVSEAMTGVEEGKQPAAAARERLKTIEPINYVRYIPSPVQLPSLEDCQSTGISLNRKRVVIMSDRGGVGDTLGNLLPDLEVSVLTLTSTTHADELEERILAWLEEGPVDGVYWLPALDVEPPLPQMSLEIWRELNRQRVKNLHRTMRTLYDSINHPGSFLITATRMGGLHGYGDSGTSAPLGGSVTGFAKAYKLERGQDGPESPLVKMVDFEMGMEAGEVAQVLMAETISDPQAVEVGYKGNDRYGVTLVETTSSGDEAGLTLDQETVYLVTGAARRLTNEIIADLASNGGTFYLLDLVAAPDHDDPRVALFRTDKKALREQLVEEIKTAVPERTASMVEKIVKAIQREESVLRAIESVERHGGTAHYTCVDMLDESAVTGVVNEIRKNHGRVNVLVHAAGLEISRTLPEKDPVQFDLVYDVKADGFFNLLRASEDMLLGATVVFGSMEARDGNRGQSDASAANDLLRKITNSLPWQRPGTRGVAISWITKRKTGISPGRSWDDPLSPVSTGFSIVRDELTASNYHGEVIIQIESATHPEGQEPNSQHPSFS